jgi:putative nucleotidyltransferase with HDIG domain
MRAELLELIPEFDLIRDADLRDQTLAVFERAMLKGGWKPADLKRMPFTLLIDPCPANMVEHVRGVTQAARKNGEILKDLYGDRMPIDLDLLTSGAILHDVGKLVEYCEEGGRFVKSRHGRMLRHPFSGVGLGYDTGLPDEVLHMIAMHAKEGTGGRALAESIIIHHADFINFEPFHL